MVRSKRQRNAVASPVESLLALLGGSRVFDLAQPYFAGMPHFPTHPPFLYGMTKKHGDFVTPGGVSSAADAIALGCHVGTHVDALCHFSCGGKLHGGLAAKPLQSDTQGLGKYSIDTIAPFLRRGVMLDLAALLGKRALPTDFVVTPQHLEQAAKAQKVSVSKGDIVVLRTGWATYWNEVTRFITGGRGVAAAGPGPGLPGARWLSERGVVAAGSDTVAFEHLPSPEMPVHVHLLVESGIHIIEMLNLEELSRKRVYEFVFIAAPLKIIGGTGSPIRPLALA
ncbi:MAG: cyclase family protein [Opitutus sp.]|nr:cyclase family protein [Opitutus sp.]